MASFKIIDTDTIIVPIYGERTSIRLSRLDAPESGPPALDAMDRQFDAGEVAKQAFLDYLDAMDDES